MKIKIIFPSIALLFCLQTFFCFASPFDDHPTLAIGSKAPAFSLKGTDGKTYTLASFNKYKILVIVFTCNHCPTAQAYEDRVIQLARDYKPRNVAVVAINPNDPSSIRLDELGYTDMSDTYGRLKKNSISLISMMALSNQQRRLMVQLRLLMFLFLTRTGNFVTRDVLMMLKNRRRRQIPLIHAMRSKNYYKAKR